MKLFIFFLSSRISLDTIVIAITGYVIVFFSLLVLNWFFKFLPDLINIKWKRAHKRLGNSFITQEKNISGEETAAIAMALHLYLSELHDEESGILTIKKTSKTYSPWSSKIYGVSNQIKKT